MEINSSVSQIERENLKLNEKNIFTCVLAVLYSNCICVSQAYKPSLKGMFFSHIHIFFFTYSKCHVFGIASLGEHLTKLVSSLEMACNGGLWQVFI